MTDCFVSVIWCVRPIQDRGDEPAASVERGNRLWDGIYQTSRGLNDTADGVIAISVLHDSGDFQTRLALDDGFITFALWPIRRYVVAHARHMFQHNRRATSDIPLYLKTQRRTGAFFNNANTGFKVALGRQALVALLDVIELQTDASRYRANGVAPGQRQNTLIQQVG